MNPLTYGGDEVSAIVIDIGTQTIRSGFAGEETPRSVIPTAYGYLDVPSSNGNGDIELAEEPVTTEQEDDRTKIGKKERVERRYFVGDQGVGIWREGMEVGNMMRDGVVSDPQAFPHILHHALHTSLKVNPREHPLIMTEPAWNPTSSRELMAEVAFEGEGVPGFYVACSSVLSAFAAGKGTALIVDIGSDLVSVVPICEGYAIRSGTKRQPLSLTLLNSQINSHLSTLPNPPSLLSHHLIKSRKPVSLGHPANVTWNQARLDKTTDSWKEYWRGRVVDGWREACAEVSPLPFVPEQATSRGSKVYEFPDGYANNFGEERFRLPEVLFNPELYLDKTIGPPEQLYATPASPTSHPLSELKGLAELVHDSVFAVDPDYRAILLQNIVLVGGGSTIPGLTDRLNFELGNKIPGNKLKIHAPGNSIERRYSAWLGGSILGSLGTFHQLWVGADEWKEHGPSILAQRCK